MDFHFETYFSGGKLGVQGILCIGFLKRSRQKQEITREQAVHDLEVSNFTACFYALRNLCYGQKFVAILRDAPFLCLQ